MFHPPTVGPGRPSAQRFSAAVCLRETEGTAGFNRGPELRGPDGDRGHGTGQAAAGVPPRALSNVYSRHYLTQTLLPNPLSLSCFFFKDFLKRLTVCLKCGLLIQTFTSSVHAMPYLYSDLALVTALCYHITIVSQLLFFFFKQTTVYLSV